MAVQANTFETYNQIGKKYDVSGMISNITPYETPFGTSIGSDVAKAVLKQWQEDSLDPAQDNAQVEGADYTARALQPTVMRQNYTQILARTFRISGTADAVSLYGRSKESAYQLAKQMKAIKKDLEYAFVGQHQDAVQGDGVTTARRMASFYNQLDPSVILDVSGGVDANRRAVAEADVMALNQTLYQQGADVTILMVRPSTAPVIASWAYSGDGGNTPGRVRDVGTGTQLVNVIDVYRSPFGKQAVKLNRIMCDGDFYLFSPDRWKKAALRPFFREVLAKTGDASTQALTGEYTLMHMNSKASGAITGLKLDAVPQI